MNYETGRILQRCDRCNHFVVKDELLHGACSACEEETGTTDLSKQDEQRSI